MIILNEVLELCGGIERFRENQSLRLKRDGQTLHLEYLEFGPTTQHAMRMVRINQFGAIEFEMRLELKGGNWIPYYHCNRNTNTELFLYRFVGIREPLCPDLIMEQGLTEIAALLDLRLQAEGFVEVAAETLFFPLFLVEGGAV